MNTLSSLLKFLGNVLGNNPNNLETENKTLVGAINEVLEETQAVGRRIPTISVQTADSSTITISANNVGTFEATYTDHTAALFDKDIYLIGVNLRSTGTNYNRVFLYGGLMSKDGNDYNCTCFGRNTGSESASGLSVRFRILVVQKPLQQ